MTRQDYGTPVSFIREVERRFSCEFTWDLAAHTDNHKCVKYLGPGSLYGENSLAPAAWSIMSEGDVGWLNPPFKRIEPWASTCEIASHAGKRVIMLTPASFGSNWFMENVDGNALVVPLNGRLYFEGETQSYKKDLMLTLWGWGCAGYCRPWYVPRESLGKPVKP